MWALKSETFRSHDHLPGHFPLPGAPRHKVAGVVPDLHQSLRDFLGALHFYLPCQACHHAWAASWEMSKMSLPPSPVFCDQQTMPFFDFCYDRQRKSLWHRVPPSPLLADLRSDDRRISIDLLLPELSAEGILSGISEGHLTPFREYVPGCRESLHMLESVYSLGRDETKPDEKGGPGGRQPVEPSTDVCRRGNGMTVSA